MSDRLAVAVTELVSALRDELAADLPRDTGAPERLLSVNEACQAHGGVWRTLVYSELQAGRLRSVKVGRRRLVPASAIAEYAARTTA